MGKSRESAIRWLAPKPMVRAPPPAMRPPLGWPTRTPVKRQRATAEALTRGRLNLISDHLKVYRSARNDGVAVGIGGCGSGLECKAIVTTKLTQMRWRHLCCWSKWEFGCPRIGSRDAGTIFVWLRLK